MCIYIYIHIYTYIEKEREREFSVTLDTYPRAKCRRVASGAAPELLGHRTTQKKLAERNNYRPIRYTAPKKRKEN